MVHCHRHTGTATSGPLSGFFPVTSAAQKLLGKASSRGHIRLYVAGIELEHMQQPVWACGPPWVKEAICEVLPQPPKDSRSLERAEVRLRHARENSVAALVVEVCGV